MNSFNHYSFGAVYEWMMACQLGIAAGDEAGYRHFILQPAVGGDFTRAMGSFESPYGTIESGWTAENGVMTSYDCVVPANTTATLYLADANAVATGFEGVTPVGMVNHNGREAATVELAAGRWHIDIHDGLASIFLG